MRYFRTHRTKRDIRREGAETWRGRRLSSDKCSRC